MLVLSRLLLSGVYKIIINQSPGRHGGLGGRCGRQWAGAACAVRPRNTATASTRRAVPSSAVERVAPQSCLCFQSISLTYITVVPRHTVHLIVVTPVQCRPLDHHTVHRTSTPVETTALTLLWVGIRGLRSPEDG